MQYSCTSRCFTVTVERSTLLSRLGLASVSSYSAYKIPIRKNTITRISNVLPTIHRWINPVVNYYSSRIKCFNTSLSALPAKQLNKRKFSGTTPCFIASHKYDVQSVKTCRSSSAIGKDVLVRGWVRSCRKQKHTTFVEINDGSCLGHLQIVTKGNKNDQLEK